MVWSYKWPTGSLIVVSICIAYAQGDKRMANMLIYNYSLTLRTEMSERSRQA